MHRHALADEQWVANCLGRSRGGFTTKLHAVTDGKGRPLHVTLTPGNRHDMVAADELLEHAQGRYLSMVEIACAWK